MTRGARAVLGALLLVAGGCAVPELRPVYRTSTVAPAGAPTLVVGVERDADNVATVRGLARGLAFALAQRGRPALDLGTLAAEALHAGRPVPAALAARLTAGVADDEVVAWLRTERLAAVVLLDVALYEQVWAPRGKRTRVGLRARVRDLEADRTWQAYTTPEVEDEPGRGFQITTEIALEALARTIAGEAEPSSLVRPPALPGLGVRW